MDRLRFDLFGKRSPIRPIEPLLESGRLKSPGVAGDILIARENAGGEYLGEWRETADEERGGVCEHPFHYSEVKVRRLLSRELERRPAALVAEALREGKPASLRHEGDGRAQACVAAQAVEGFEVLAPAQAEVEEAGLALVERVASASVRRAPARRDPKNPVAIPRETRQPRVGLADPLRFLKRDDLVAVVRRDRPGAAGFLARAIRPRPIRRGEPQETAQRPPRPRKKVQRSAPF